MRASIVFLTLAFYTSFYINIYILSSVTLSHISFSFCLCAQKGISLFFILKCRQDALKDHQLHFIFGICTKYWHFISWWIWTAACCLDVFTIYIPFRFMHLWMFVTLFSCTEIQNMPYLCSKLHMDTLTTTLSPCVWKIIWNLGSVCCRNSAFVKEASTRLINFPFLFPWVFGKAFEYLCVKKNVYKSVMTGSQMTSLI